MTALIPTPEQQAILDLGLTSIRVRAGAGTGKTTTVGMVIANLVEHHDLEPEQILGVTFTNKAAAELADRVRSGLPEGIDQGRQVEIHTYHGFAAQVLSEFGALAGVDNRSRIITPTFARQLMTETFHHRSFDHVDITQARSLDRIRRLGDRLGDHLLEPEDLLTAAPANSDEVWSERVEMAETLEQYRLDKQRLRVVDYSDLVTLSTRVVTEFPDLADTIRSRYRAVVLDEYQDTNPAQRELLLRVFGDGFPVIAVGDEDQTIYEWRGASAENFELFPTQFRTKGGGPAHELGLTLNRRSAQVILDVANEVRRRANPGAETLRAANEDAPGEVVAYWASDALGEAEWIARTFEQLQAAGARWSDMAVLFRKNKDFAVVVDALARHDIPVEVANIGGLFSVPEVAEVRAWLQALDHPEDSGALTQILFGSRYRLGMADIAPITRRVATGDEYDDSETPTPVTLIEAIEVAESIDGLRDDARIALSRFASTYRKLLTESQGQTLVETCRSILDRTGAWQDIEALPPNSRLTARLNIYRLLDLAEEWSPLKGRPSVGAFLDYLRAMEDEPADELDSARLSGEDAVTLVTIHRAKGLEWENVAIPAVTKGNFPSRSQQFPDPIRFADHVPVEIRIDSLMDDLPGDRKERDTYMRDRHMIQEWRVGYVALTRAKKRLFLSGAHWYGLPEPSKNPKEPSELFELVKEGGISAGEVELTERPALLTPPVDVESPDPLFESGWAGAVRSALADFDSMGRLATDLAVRDEYERIVEGTRQRLFELAEPSQEPGTEEPPTVSVTGLVTYAQCPKRFYWSDVDPLPRRPNPAATRGTEVHRRIELHQRGQVPFDEVSESLYDVPDGPGGGSKGAYETYEASRFAGARASLIEVPFTLGLETGFRVRGRIDAVYVDPAGWEVVDFKSGRPSDDPSRIVQLQAYAVAVDAVEFGPPKPEEMKVTFAYLGDGLTEVSYDADPEWVDEARRSLEELTRSIADSQYEEDPGPWCGSCDFLQFCAPGQAKVSS